MLFQTLYTLSFREVKRSGTTRNLLLPCRSDAAGEQQVPRRCAPRNDIADGDCETGMDHCIPAKSVACERRCRRGGYELAECRKARSYDEIEHRWVERAFRPAIQAIADHGASAPEVVSQFRFVPQRLKPRLTKGPHAGLKPCSTQI